MLVLLPFISELFPHLCCADNAKVGDFLHKHFIFFPLSPFYLAFRCIPQFSYTHSLGDNRCASRRYAPKPFCGCHKAKTRHPDVECRVLFLKSYVAIAFLLRVNTTPRPK